MDSSRVALLSSTVVFALFLVWKMRPAMSAMVSAGGRAAAAALADAQARVASATDDRARALALCDAADAAERLGKTESVSGFVLRALRADPTSREVVERAIAALARRPAALESALWRHLASVPWTGEARDAAASSLHALASIYGKKKRTEPRARALEHAAEALTSRAASRDGA